MSGAEDRLIEEWARTWSSHDVQQLLPLYSDDVVYEDVALGAVNHGQAELRAFAEQFWGIFPDAALEVTSRFTGDRRGGIEWVLRATHQGDSPGLPATGKRVEVRGVAMVEIADGKISRCRDYYNFATLLQQIGMLPTG